MENLLKEMLIKVSDISDLLSEISGKLDNINGISSLDDIVSKIDEVGSEINETINIATTDIVGDSRYNLSDIHEDLSLIDSTISNKD